MGWRRRPDSRPLDQSRANPTRALMHGALVATVLVGACAALLLTAPVDGDFWWNDAPRHALNGVFVRDFVAAHPWHQPAQWAIDYYLRRPALTILFYPPLFYVAEAVVFAVLGVSHFTAQLTVTLFLFGLGAAAFVLARRFLPRLASLGAALLVIGTPEAALWGRQVMLDLPAYALVAASAVCLSRYIAKSRPAEIYLTAAFLLAAIYTKYNAGFIAPALAVTFVAAKGRAALTDRHALIAGLLSIAGLVPAVFMLHRFGAVNMASVAGLPGTLPLSSLACWIFYLQALPSQLGWVPMILGAGGLLFILKRIAVGQDRASHVLLAAWLIAGYVFFSVISLKEPRDTVMVLLPVAIAAPLLLVETLPRPFGDRTSLALGVLTLIYTLAFCPVPRVGGYNEVASYLATAVPKDGVVLYSGFRDANLIFDLAARGDRPDIAVIRVDKLLLAAPVGERRRGVKQAGYDEAAITAMLRDLGASYFVVQPDFWSDIRVMALFGNVMNGPDYRKAAHFDLNGDLSTQDGVQGIDILTPTYPIAATPARISIDMPLAGQRFEGATQQ